MSVSGEASQEDGRIGANLHSAERGFTAAFELVATPALFALFGHGIDRVAGTGPVFALGLAVAVAVYVIWKLWYQYNAEMDRLDVERRTATSTEPVDLSGSVPSWMMAASKNSPTTVEQ